MSWHFYSLWMTLAGTARDDGPDMTEAQLEGVLTAMLGLPTEDNQ